MKSFTSNLLYIRALPSLMKNISLSFCPYYTTVVSD